MPPTGRPYPRFIADAPQEKRPYGRFAERLAAEFAEACAPLEAEAGQRLDSEGLRWFPERAWGGRVYVPVTAPGVGLDRDDADAPGPGEESPEGPASIEFFGHVSFVRADDSEEPSDLRARADFTDVTAEDNPDWRIDLNDDVIGAWHGDGGRGGDITLVWGLPLVRGAAAATAELDEQLLDQAAVNDGRFTLVAVDAVHGFGDDHFLEIHLWDSRVNRIARESLYDDSE